MNLQIKQIVLETHKSLHTNASGFSSNRSKISKLIIFDILPALIAIVLIINGNIIIKGSAIIGYLLTMYSIFAGLLFSLNIVIVDKAKKIKETINTDKEENFYYVKRYLRFSKHLITRISFTILISLSLIMLSLCTQLNFGLHNISNWACVNKSLIISFLIYYFTIQFVLLILHIISEMYEVFLEEIK